MAHADHPSGPKSTSVAWALAGLRGGPMPEGPLQPLTSNWRRSRSQVWEVLASFGTSLPDGFEVATYRRVDRRDEILLELDLAPPVGKRLVFRCAVESSPPHRIRTFGIGPPLAEGYTIRSATRCDAPALAALETMVAHESGHARVSIDRTSHYWNHLMLTKSKVFVAEQDDEVVAAIAGATLPALADGRECCLAYLHQGRVLPDHQGQGLSRTLAARSSEVNFPATDGTVFFIASGNSQALAPWPEEFRWSVRPERLLFDVASLAAEPMGTRTGAVATVKDSGAVAALLNATHEKEALFLPYTEERLIERLTRVPSAYSWPQFQVLDDAAIGIGLTTEHRKRQNADGSTIETCRAPIFDFGFKEERGMASFEALLRGACTELVDSGVTHLTLFSSPGSPGYSRLRELCCAAEPYVVITFGVGETAAPSCEGIYMDHVYF